MGVKAVCGVYFNLLIWCPEPESNRHGLFKAEEF